MTLIAICANGHNYVGNDINVQIQHSNSNANVSSPAALRQNRSRWKLPIAIISITLLQIFLYYADRLYAYAHGTHVLDSPIIKLCAYNAKKTNECWRLFTYVLVHLNTPHLCGNMIWQIIVGVHLEINFGWWRCILIYIVGAFGALFPTVLLCPATNMLGASGAIYTLMAVVVVDAFLRRKKLRYGIWQACGYLAICLIFLVYDIACIVHGNDDGVVHIGHIFGCITGVYVGTLIWLQTLLN